MARPAPKTLMKRNYNINKQLVVEEVVAAQGVYAVFLNGEPINVRSESLEQPIKKYRRTTFVNPGMAFNLANKLNIQYSTDSFKVYDLLSGEQINET